MKKMIHMLLVMVMGFIITGCGAEEKYEYTDTYKLEYFYLETCSSCQAFSEKVIPLIEEEFGAHMEIVRYDLDSLEGMIYYDEVIEKIEGFDWEEDYASVPFVALDGYFAKLGVSSSDGKEFVRDLKRAVIGESLGNQLSNLRYLYIDTKVQQ